METSSYLNKWVEHPACFTKRDLLMYAVGIGCDDLRFIYEDNDEFSAFPTFPVVLSFTGTDEDVVSFPSDAMVEGQPSMPPLEGVRTVLDGERHIEKINELDVDGMENLVMRTRIVGIHKRGSGASVESETGTAFLQNFCSSLFFF